LDEYLRLYERGQLYESLMQPGDDRSKLKLLLFRDVLFGEADLGYASPLKRRFEERFPTVCRMLRDLKQNDYAHAAWLMQSYEATLVFAIICRRLMIEHPDVPIITIHDSILTVPAANALVRQVIIEEFAAIGVTPRLKTEIYE